MFINLFNPMYNILVLQQLEHDKAHLVFLNPNVKHVLFIFIILYYIILYNIILLGMKIKIVFRISIRKCNYDFE